MKFIFVLKHGNYLKKSQGQWKNDDTWHDFGTIRYICTFLSYWGHNTSLLQGINGSNTMLTYF